MKRLLMVCFFVGLLLQASVPIPVGFFKQPSSGTTTISPTDIPDLGAWWKADSITGLSNNDPVSTWNDNKGSNNLTGSGTSRPLWLSNASGGMPGVKFDGVNDEMSMASTLTLTLNTWTVVAVLIGNSGGMQWGASSGNMQWQSSPQLVLFNGSDSALIISDAFSSATNLTAVFSQQALVSGGNHCFFWENLTARGDKNPTTGNNFTFNRMGRWSGATAWGTQTFCELLVYNRAITGTERTNLYNNYLKPRYSALP